MKSRTRYLFIVGRDQGDLYDALVREHAGEEHVEILWDRRQAERRQRVRGYKPEGRRVERRHLSFNGFAVVREEE